MLSHRSSAHFWSPVGPRLPKHHGLSASLLHTSTESALPGQKTKLAPQISRFLRTLLCSHNTHTPQAQASPKQHCALGNILYSIPHSPPFSFEAVNPIPHLASHRESWAHVTALPWGQAMDRLDYSCEVVLGSGLKNKIDSQFTLSIN